MGWLGAGKMGGNFLAVAGGAAGFGQGLEQVGQQGMKQQMAEKINALQQQREEAIERLRGSEQEKLQGQSQDFQAAQSDKRITAASNAAAATRTFEHEENTAKLKSGESRTNRMAQAKEYSARVGAESRSNAGSQKDFTWKVHTVQSPGVDKNGNPNPLLSKTTQVVESPSGASYIQAGDKLIKFDATTNAPARDPASIARIPKDRITPVQADLLNDPLGVVKSGPNAGMTKAEAFEAQFGYIPTQWMSRAQEAHKQGGSQSSKLSLPAGMVNGIGGPGATSQQTGSFGGGGGGGEESSESSNEENDSQTDNEPAFQSNANQVYGNVAQ